jgi:hypothetical protein
MRFPRGLECWSIGSPGGWSRDIVTRSILPRDFARSSRDMSRAKPCQAVTSRDAREELALCPAAHFSQAAQKRPEDQQDH